MWQTASERITKIKFSGWHIGGAMMKEEKCEHEKVNDITE